VVNSAAGSLSSNEDGVDYGLKHSILDKDNGLFLSGSCPHVRKTGKHRFSRCMFRISVNPKLSKRTS